MAASRGEPAAGDLRQAPEVNTIESVVGLRRLRTVCDDSVTL
jgi:hypothetical protein